MLCVNAIVLCVNAILMIDVGKCKSGKCKSCDKRFMDNHITIVHQEDDGDDCAEKLQKRSGTGVKRVRFELFEDNNDLQDLSDLVVYIENERNWPRSGKE